MFDADFGHRQLERAGRQIIFFVFKYGFTESFVLKGEAVQVRCWLQTVVSVIFADGTPKIHFRHFE